MIQRRDFGAGIEAVTIAAGDLQATVLTRGGILQDVQLAGVDHSLTVGSDRAEDYSSSMAFFGALVGPVANRIGGGTFQLGGKTFALEHNEGGQTCLHSGQSGVHGQVWEVERVGADAVALSLPLSNGLGGFPGNRRVTATYSVEAPATLVLVVEATTDARTPINIASHAYWNLDGTETAAGHVLRVDATEITKLDAMKVPTGERLAVAGTGYDYHKAREAIAGGATPLDINFCLADARRDAVAVAELIGQSGVRLTLSTTEPGLQVFDAHALSDAGATSTNGHKIGRHCGIALEAQGWPDAVNQPAFPSVILSPGETYRQETRFAFSRPDQAR